MKSAITSTINVMISVRIPANRLSVKTLECDTEKRISHASIGIFVSTRFSAGSINLKSSTAIDAGLKEMTSEAYNNENRTENPAVKVAAINPAFNGVTRTLLQVRRKLEALLWAGRPLGYGLFISITP